MSKTKKRKKVIDQLITFIGHDYGAYSDIWRWNDLPPLVRENYELIEKELIEWQEKGYVYIWIIMNV